MIIIKEKDYVEDVLRTLNLSQSMPMKKFIIMLCQYYYPEHNNNQAELLRFIEGKLNELHLPDYRYNECDYESYIKGVIRKIYHGDINREIRNPSSISITVPELELIQKAKTDREQKVLTALYVLAKLAYEPTGWVGYKRSDIFNLANVRVTRRERNRIIYELQKQKLITLNSRVDNTSVKVMLKNGDVAFYVTDFDHIGNTYIEKYKEGWQMCKNCGKLIRMKKGAGRPKKYCKDCASLVDNQKRTQRRKLNANCPKNINC